MVDQLNYDLIGQRLKMLRAIAGFTRQDFEKNCNISSSTLKSWEKPSLNKGLTKKGAYRIVKAMNDLGMNCNIEWLLYGKGEQPKNPLINKDYQIPDIDYQDNLNILKDVYSFQENNPNSITTMIEDDGMEPTYSPGDYVGGILNKDLNLENFIGELCIIETTDNIKLVRRLERYTSSNSFCLITENKSPKSTPPILFNVKIKAIARIIWFRKRSC